MPDFMLCCRMRFFCHAAATIVVIPGLTRDPGRPCTAVLFPPLETLHATSLPCGFVRNPRPDVAVRWIARPRLIRRPAGQRWARPKFILSEAGGKFMNFSVRRASMSGWRRIQRRHSFLPFFCCRKKGSTSVAQRARKPFAAVAIALPVSIPASTPQGAGSEAGMTGRKETRKG